jgi:FixJ family two-component response regulator
MKTPAGQRSKREQEVYELLTLGYSNHEITRILNISYKTVETHVHNIYAKEPEPLCSQGPARRFEFLSRLLR